MRSPESIALHPWKSILLRFFCTVLERVDDVTNIVTGAKRQIVYLIALIVLRPRPRQSLT